jgi:hypothetical protein
MRPEEHFSGVAGWSDCSNLNQSEKGTRQRDSSSANPRPQTLPFASRNQTG